MPEIIFSHKTFSYQIIRKRISSIRLSLKSRRKFLVTCPWLTPDFVIKNFVNSHAGWIAKNSSKISPTLKIISLKKVNILDDDYQLIINKTSGDSVIIIEDEHKIYVNSSHLSESRLKTIIEKRMKRFSLALIKDEIEKIKKDYPFFKYRTITVRNQKTRFGSCSSAGSLNFNWQIIFFPKDKFRHILFHELVHLEVKNHSRHFWETLENYDPSWKTNNLWLKKEGIKHFIINK